MRDLPSKGISYGNQQGHLDLLPEISEKLICKEPISDYFDVDQRPFARGKFAAVRRARCLRTGEFYAAKVVRKRRRAADVRHEALHEAAVLALSNEHPKIVKLFRVFESMTEMTFVLEMAAGGELHRVIDEEEHIEEEVTKKYLKDILCAIRFLHSYNIAHLDLKPQNLLLTGPHPDSEVKLCDFGISRHLAADIEVRDILGTPDYVAPEILQYEPISLATDMWSVGVLTYVLLTGHSPFGGDNKQQTFLNISQGDVDFPDDLFDGISSQAQTFISELLVVDPRSRLTVDEAVNHAWLSQPTHKSPLLEISNTTEAHVLTTPSSKRPNSPAKTYNKENNPAEPVVPVTCDIKEPFCSLAVSPPSKRECRDMPETRIHRSGIEYPLSVNASQEAHSPKVSEQIRNFEKRIQSHSQEDMRCSSVDRFDTYLPLSAGIRTFCASLDTPTDRLTLPASPKHFFQKDETRLERRHSLRKGNLNRSFGSVDYRDSKDKLRNSLRLSPLCLRRDRKKCDNNPDQKYGRELQDIVRENTLIC